MAPGHHRRPGAAGVENAPAELRSGAEAGEEDQQVEPGLRGVLAERDLGVQAGEEEERHEGHRHEKEQGVVHREPAAAEDAHLNQRVRRPQLEQHEGRQEGDTGDDAHPGERVAPAPGARLLKAEHRERHPRGHQHRPAQVERRGMALVGRLGPGDQDQGDHRDRHVDPEDGPPGDLGEIAARERPNAGEHTGDPEEGRHGLAPLLHREGGHHDGERSGEHHGRKGPLNHPEEDDPGLGQVAGGRGPAEGRADGEAHHPDHHHAPVPGDVRQAAAEGEQGRQRQQVAVHDPLHARGRQREVLLELRDGDGDDGLVDERHRHREDHRREHQPLVLSPGHERAEA